MKTLIKYEKLIKSGKFTEQELISFRKFINGSSPLSDIDCSILVRKFERKAEEDGIKLTKEQQNKGIAWLRTAAFKKDGSPRLNCILGYFEQQVVNNFKSFSCVGLYNNSGNYYRQYVPIYRCVANDGNYFDYACLMMGTIKILSIGSRDQSISHCNQPEWDLARYGYQMVR